MINVVTRQERTIWSSGKARHNYPKAKAFALAAAVLGVIWFAPRPAAAQVIHACVANKTGALRIASTCKKNESPLTFNQAGPAGPTGPSGAMGVAGPAGPTGATGQVGPIANVTQLNLVGGPVKQTLATLQAAPNGGGALTFFDTNGKRVALVGMSDDATQAGLSAFDGNALASGNGVTRAIFGVAGTNYVTNNGGPGYGVALLGADGATVRATISSSLDGTTLPSVVTLFDSSGKLRTGLTVDPPLDFVGFFSGVLTVNGATGATSGPLESEIGNAYDNSASYSILFDSSGNLRSEMTYFPPGNFNGFITQDGAGDNLSLLGNALTAGASVEANESFMSLDDTTGTQRLVDFQNSTNQGGLDFNPGGAIDSSGGWGNP